MNEKTEAQRGWVSSQRWNRQWVASWVWTRGPPVLLPVPFPSHPSTLWHLITKQPLNAQPGSVISVVRKHVSANKTFILFVNRLLNKVNITVIEGKTHPSKCHVHTMPEHQHEMGKVAWHPTVLRCQTTGQRDGCADCPKTVYMDGVQAACWDPIHFWGLEPDNLCSYSNSLLCGSLSFTGGIQSWVANWECIKEKQREGLKTSAMYQLALGVEC